LVSKTRADRAVNDLLKDAFLPTVDEVSMEAVAARVTVGKDEVAREAFEHVGLIDDLVEHGRKTLVVTFGASTVSAVRGVGNMIHVVLGIKLAIPARGKHDLSTNAIVAVLVDVGLVGHLVTFHGSFVADTVVHAVESKDGLQTRLLNHVGLGPCLARGRLQLVFPLAKVFALERVASDHSEAGRESHSVNAGVRILSEVVARFRLAFVIVTIRSNLHEHASSFGNEFEGAISVLKVHVRSPVSGLVLSHCAASAVGGKQLFVRDVHGEVWRLLAPGEALGVVDLLDAP
jgi:hypothetical protein